MTDETADPAKGPAPTLPRFARSSLVLVAEDNPTNRFVAVAMLQKLGLHVDAVANGIEAVAAAQSTLYDMVLMDMQMPEMDGLEAAKLIRLLPEPHGRVPIVGVTANAFREDHARCLDAGMQAVVTKPFHWTDLALVIAPHMALEGDARADDPRVADPSAWRTLIHNVGSDAAHAITSVFLSDSRKRLARIAAHLADVDFKAIGREAHTLKSSGDLLGFERMTQIATRLESVARNGADAEETGSLARELADAFVAVEALCVDRLAGKA